MNDEQARRADERVLAAQLGRPPREPWRVVARCRFGHPTVTASPQRLSDGSPFPTLFWLTCPWLVELIGAEESAGEVAAWAGRVAAEPDLARRLRAADAAYREFRAAEGGGVDACAGTGIAGQRDPTATKCLHAHVAAALTGIDDPIGGSLLGRLQRECPADRCAGLLADAEGAGR